MQRVLQCHGIARSIGGGNLSGLTAHGALHVLGAERLQRLQEVGVDGLRDAPAHRSHGAGALS